MIRFYPLDMGIAFDAVPTDLLSFNWQEMAADFIIPNDDRHVLRISFQGDTIVRILDELPLSTESEATRHGFIPYHFAYRVEGADFERQSPTWLAIGSVNHFQFLTDNGCLDVLAIGEPEFSIVARLEATSPLGDSRLQPGNASRT